MANELDHTYFCLQSRGCDAEDAKRFEAAAARGDGKINLVSQTGIQYCPFCGTKLETWLARHRKEAEELVKHSQPFMMKFFSSNES